MIQTHNSYYIESDLQSNIDSEFLLYSNKVFNLHKTFKVVKGFIFSHCFAD